MVYFTFSGETGDFRKREVEFEGVVVVVLTSVRKGGKKE
jgi:hypothetical protein